MEQLALGSKENKTYFERAISSLMKYNKIENITVNIEEFQDDGDDSVQITLQNIGKSNEELIKGILCVTTLLNKMSCSYGWGLGSSLNDVVQSLRFVVNGEEFRNANEAYETKS